MRAPVIRLAVVFLRRLAVPLVLFAAFNALSVFVYTRLEGLRWLDALFWITHPQSIEYGAVHDATKVFALLVYRGSSRSRSGFKGMPSRQEGYGRTHGMSRVAVTPDGRLMYVSNPSSNNVAVHDMRTHTLMTTIPVGRFPHCLALASDGKRLYVGNMEFGDLSVIDSTANQMVATTQTAAGPHALVLSRDDKFRVPERGGHRWPDWRDPCDCADGRHSPWPRPHPRRQGAVGR